MMQWPLMLLAVMGGPHDGETPPRIRSSPTTAATADGNFCAANGIYFRQLLSGQEVARRADATSSFTAATYRFAEQMKVVSHVRTWPHDTLLYFPFF